MATSQQPERGPDKAPDSKNLPVPTMGAPLPVAAGETSSSAIAARERAAVEARFLVAMNRPRLFDEAYARLMTACKRPSFAEAARYSKPVGNEKVYGLSIRFAEEAANLWGNIEVSSFLVYDDTDKRIYRTVGTDLETNSTHAVDSIIEKTVERKVVRQGMEVLGRRVNTKGEVVHIIRATEDDLLVKVNNQISKARRNVILPLIPADVRDECENQIIATLQNRDAEDPEGARKKIVLAFHAMGISVPQLEDMLGKPLVQINPAELTLLRSYYTSIKDGEASFAEIVEMHQSAHGAKKATAAGENPPPANARTGTAGLAADLGAKAGKVKEQPKAEEKPKAEERKPEGAKMAPFPCTDCGAQTIPHRPGCKAKA